VAQGKGKFVWYELMTTDSAAAQRFYCDVVGWTATDSGMPDADYTLLSAGPTMVGGLMDIPEEACRNGAQPGWVGYVGVDDVDGYAARVKAAGGTIHKAAEDIPGVGRFCVVADPQGAAFVLFKGTGGEMPASVPPNTPGHVGWHELMAGEREAAFAFYAGMFGWTKGDAIDLGPVGIYQLFATDGVPNGGMMTKMPEMPRAFWQYYVNVPALDAAVARITAGGGKVVHGPVQVPGGSWILNGIDPQGAHFALVAPAR
jgi:predicted enzyme related to lactoylglutathione lyase